MRRQCGFTLFEVLIAFLILSVGLAGVASLQALSKVGQHQAIQRSRAVALADEIVEMIRANPTAVATYNLGTTALGAGSRPAPGTDCSTAACDSAAMAVYDLWAWEQALDGAAVTAADGGGTGAGLLQPRGCIRFVADAANGRANTGQLDIFIQWRGLVEGTDAVQAGDFVCGGGAGVADPGQDGFRRQVVVRSYVLDEREL